MPPEGADQDQSLVKLVAVYILAYKKFTSTEFLLWKLESSKFLSLESRIIGGVRIIGGLDIVIIINNRGGGEGVGRS